MFTSEGISTPSVNAYSNSFSTYRWVGGYHSTPTPTIDSKPKPAVDYWREIGDKVSLPQHRHTISTPSLPEALVMDSPSSQSEKKGFKNSGVMPIIGPIYHRSKLVRGTINTLAVALAVHTFIPPHQTEASNSLVPIVQQPAGWTCVGEAQARQMDPLCEVGHGMFPCSPDSAYYVDENGYPHFAEKFHSTSSLLGEEWCEFTCESPNLVDQPGADAQAKVHTHQWQLTEVCYPVKQKNVATQSTNQVTQPPTENYGTTQTAPPTEYYGTVQTAGQVIDGQVQSTPSGGDGYCDILFTLNDPDCKTFSLFGQGGGEAQQYQEAPAPIESAPTTNDQVPYVPSTTGTTEWQAPITTGDSGGGESNNSGFGCQQRLRAQYNSPLQIVKLLNEIALQCH